MPSDPNFDADTPPLPETIRRRGSGAQLVYTVLRDEILELVLPPGSPIDEVALSDRLGMSRTPIREALVRLAGEGLVSTLPNRSTIVSQIDFLNLHHFYDAITLMYRVTTRNAARAHTPADLDPIRARQAEFAAAVARQDALGMIASNREFHVAIAEAGHNPYFTQLFTRVLDDGRRLLRLYYRSFEDKLPQQFVTEHEDMIAAIEARDVYECDRLATVHGEQIVGQLQQLTVKERAPAMTL